LIGALAALAGFSAAQAQKSANPLYVTRPDWTSTPNGNDVERAFPVKLRESGLAGAGSMVCHISAEGRLEPCAVVGEAPLNTGVGAGMLALSGRFRMKLKDAEGRPVAGRLIRIPVVFRSEGQGTPAVGNSPGGQAVMLDPSGGGGRKVDCPTTADTKRQGVVRPLYLGNDATNAELAQAIAAIGKTEGVTSIACQVGADRTLQACTPPENMTPPQTAAFTQFLALQRAPEKTQDGKPVSGLLIISFDWGQIAPSIKVLAEAEATAAAR
jgi:hypothetical protein